MQARDTSFAPTNREDEEVEINRFDKLNDRQRQQINIFLESL